MVEKVVREGEEARVWEGISRVVVGGVSRVREGDAREAQWSDDGAMGVGSGWSSAVPRWWRAQVGEAVRSKE